MSKEAGPPPPEAGMPSKDRMIPPAALGWGQTPFDNLSREELLRLVQGYHAALVASRSLLRQYRFGQETSPYWGPEGSGGIALGKAEALMTLSGENEEDGAGLIYRAFFRYAGDLLFPDAPNGRGRWRIGEDGQMLNPGYPDMRPLEWRDLMPQKGDADGG